MNVDDVAQFSAQYIGMGSSILTLILGIVHVCYKRPTISWPDHGFADDVQKITWRFDTFTLRPDEFVDLWTPTIFGIIGILAHTRNFVYCRRVTSSYLMYFLFLTVQMLFADLGYRGGFGIIVGAVSGLAVFMALIAHLLSRDRDGSAAIKNGLTVAL